MFAIIIAARSKGVLSNGALLIIQFYHISSLEHLELTSVSLVGEDFCQFNVFVKFRVLNTKKQRGDHAKGVIAIRSRERSERVLSNGAPLIIRTYHISSLEPLKVSILAAKKHFFFDHLSSSENPRFKELLKGLIVFSKSTSVWCLQKIRERRVLGVE